MIKKFIRGNKDRGQEVIKALEDLGGVNKNEMLCDQPNAYYFLDKDNYIIAWNENSDIAFVIKECFEEIILKDKPVITNKQFAYWYFDQLFINSIVQFKVADNGSICSRMYDYVNDDDPTPVKYIRFNFGEWIPIEKVDII